MFVTMVISGIWHGADWGFIIWGALHAVGRCLTRDLELTFFWKERMPRIVKQMAVFTFVTFTWIFFRAPKWENASLIVQRIFWTAGMRPDPKFPLLWGIVAGGGSTVHEPTNYAVLEWDAKVVLPVHDRFLLRPGEPNLSSFISPVLVRRGAIMSEKTCNPRKNVLLPGRCVFE